MDNSWPFGKNFLKDETRNPTGSFKDRPISCAISKAREEEREGVAVTVDNPSVMESVKRLSSLTGVFAEPRGASSVASLRKLKTKGLLEKGETVVCMITGSGFKDTSTIEEYVQVEGKAVAPSLAEVERELERKLA